MKDCTKFFERQHGGLIPIHVHVVSLLDSRFEPWLGSLHCVVGEDTLLDHIATPSRCVNRHWQI